jgi:hypothetical protein
MGSSGEFISRLNISDAVYIRWMVVMLAKALNWMIAYTGFFGEPIQHWVPTFAVIFVIMLALLIWLDHRTVSQLGHKK